MNPYAVRLLWAVGVVSIVAGCAVWLYGCGPAPKAVEAAEDFNLAMACKEDEVTAKALGTSCKDVERRLNESAACRQLRPSGYHLDCKEQEHDAQ